MEKLNKTTNETKEKVNVTEEIMPRLAKRYAGAISKVEKEGGVYTITFTKGYTIFGETTRKAKNIPGIMWYSRIATEEKEEGKFDFEKWKKFFTENKIVWDGKNIPEYILTAEQIKKEAEPKAENKKEPKAENKKETKADVK